MHRQDDAARASGRAFLHALGHSSSGAESNDRASDRQCGVVLLGRQSECARLDQLLDETRRGGGGALVVGGEPGIGKTALLSYARAAAGDMRVLSAAGVESECELGFAALGALLRPLLGYLGDLVAVQRAALESALGLRAGGFPDRFAVGVATLSLLARAAEDSPLLVLVDDAHWLDLPSADALSFAARRLGGDRVVMLLAAREGERLSFDAAGMPQLRLDGLGRDDCGSCWKQC